MDENKYRENRNGYDKDTFGEFNRDNYNEKNYGQSDYSQGENGRDAYRQTPPDGGSFYYSSEAPRSNGFGIASMVLGIISLVLFCTCLNIPPAILAVIFGIIHINRRTGSIGFAIAGIVTSIISVIVTVIMIIVLYIAGSNYATWFYTMPFESFMDDYYYGDDYGDDYFDYYNDIDDDFDFEIREENDL